MKLPRIIDSANRLDDNNRGSVSWSCPWCFSESCSYVFL